MNHPTTNSCTLVLTKEIGKLWILKDVTPFRKNFEQFFDKELGHDIGKLMTCGCANDVLDILAAGDTKMEVDLRMSSERVELPDYVEFALVEPCPLAAKYYVNNCPGRPRMVAWVSASAKEIFKPYPVFAYIKKK